MPRLTAVLLAVCVIALCAWGVALQFQDDAPAPFNPASIVPLEVGEVLEIDFTLSDVDDLPKPRNLMAWYGSTATVLYTWSVPCPCVEDLQPRLLALHERFNAERSGVRWVALAGEPKDTREAVREKLARIEAFYPLLLDPDQRVCRRLGLLYAGQVAVLDGAGRLVYRGAVDRDYTGGQAEFLAQVLEAVSAGEAVPFTTRARAYGCEFSVPASCLEGVAEETPPEVESEDPGE